MKSPEFYQHIFDLKQSNIKEELQNEFFNEMKKTHFGAQFNVFFADLLKRRNNELKNIVLDGGTITSNDLLGRLIVEIKYMYDERKNDSSFFGPFPIGSYFTYKFDENYPRINGYEKIKEDVLQQFQAVTDLFKTDFEHAQLVIKFTKEKSIESLLEILAFYFARKEFSDELLSNPQIIQVLRKNAKESSIRKMSKYFSEWSLDNWIDPEKMDQFKKIEMELIDNNYLTDNMEWEQSKHKTECCRLAHILIKKRFFKFSVNGDLKKDWHYIQFLSVRYFNGNKTALSDTWKHKIKSYSIKEDLDFFQYKNMLNNVDNSIPQ